MKCIAAREENLKPDLRVDGLSQHHLTQSPKKYALNANRSKKNQFINEKVNK